MYKKLLNVLKPNEDVSKKKELLELYKKPAKEKKDDMPIFQDFKANYTQQADLLFLPRAKFGYQYLLVVVDDHTRKFDAYPLKNKESTNVLSAFKSLYQHSKYIKLPKALEFDAGTEFHGEVEDYFKSLNIRIRYAPTARHRMQGLVESKNQLIGNILFHLLNLKELSDLRGGKKVEAVDWYKSKAEFEKLIDTLNEHSEYKPLKTQKQDTPLHSKSNMNLLNIGDNVRVLLDHPINIAHSKRLIGKFRSADIRWSLDVKKIEWVVIEPGEPPMYRIEGEKHLRTIQQLQKVNGYEHLFV
jgi:hypothetical protein